jgi:hypothetical protein
MRSKSLLLFLLCGLILSSCGSYYQKNIKFHQLLLSQRVAEADHLLSKDKRAERKKTRLLYFLNRGITNHLMGNYETSNQFFEQAYITHEDYSTKPIDEALAFLINPTITDYRGEDHEALLIHYYKALNFLQLGKRSEALVECRRLNIKLNILSDKYTTGKKYRRDAFIHTLMGLVYQANHDYNNAFIAYRNAVEIYQEDYKLLFGLGLPLQLQKDLIYTAYKTGFHKQVNYYKKLFQLDYDPSLETEAGEVVLLWNNGLGPIKSEWNIDFLILKGQGGVVNFVNEDLGLFFPFPLIGDGETSQGLADLHLLRAAFPKYVERPLLYDQAVVHVNGGTYRLEVVEDINAISFQTLHQRMLLEFSKSLLRVALKKLAEYQVRKQNEVLGTMLGVVNFVTEAADTRNWQSIPHHIYYTRIKLPSGSHQLNFCAYSSRNPHIKEQQKLEVHINSQETKFLPITTLAHANN